MAFRLPARAREWFKNIAPDFDEGGAPQFDMYYFCLMMGLAAGRKNHDSEKTVEFIQYFPGEFRTRGSVVLALFLSRELRSRGIQYTERTALHKAIAGLVDPKDPANLSAAGMKELNAYAHGGFEVLLEEIGDLDSKPQHLETFLPLYHRKLEQIVQASGTAGPPP